MIAPGIIAITIAAAAALHAISVSAQSPACSVKDITVKSIRARFVDECRSSSCPSMRGIAVLTNNCREAVGVQLKITAYDGAGAPVATRDGWPASTENIPPGDYEFSLDHWLEFDPAIKNFALRAIAVRRWR